MEKYFCDFCKREIPPEEHCALQIFMPEYNTRMFDACKECIKKIETCMGLK